MPRLTGSLRQKIKQMILEFLKKQDSYKGAVKIYREMGLSRYYDDIQSHHGKTHSLLNELKAEGKLKQNKGKGFIYNKAYQSD